MSDINVIARRVDAMKHRAVERDAQMANVLSVRQGALLQM
jgi:hypothetical protein